MTPETFVHLLLSAGLGIEVGIIVIVPFVILASVVGRR